MSGRPVLIVSVIEINGPREPQADIVSVSTLALLCTVSLDQSVISEGISGTSNSCRPIRNAVQEVVTLMWLLSFPGSCSIYESSVIGHMHTFRQRFECRSCMVTGEFSCLGCRLLGQGSSQRPQFQGDGASFTNSQCLSSICCVGWCAACRATSGSTRVPAFLESALWV